MAGHPQIGDDRRMAKFKIPAGLVDAVALTKKPKAQLAREAGTSPQQLDRLLKGEREFTREWADRLAGPIGVASRDLMFDGHELRRVAPDQAFSPDPEFNPDGGQGFAAGQPYRPLTAGARPEIDVRPGAGQGQDGDRVAYAVGAGGVVTGHRVIAEWVMPPPFYRHELHANPDGTLFMQVVGNSMLPTLAPGDRVIVDTTQNTFGPDAIYVFDDGDGEPRVKSLKKMLGTSDVRIISDNRDLYGEDLVPIQSIRIIGRVVGKVSKL